MSLVITAGLPARHRVGPKFTHALSALLCNILVLVLVHAKIIVVVAIRVNL